MFHMTAKKREPYQVQLQLNGVRTSMRVDTGAVAKSSMKNLQENQIEGNLVRNRPQMETAKMKL